MSRITARNIENVIENLLQELKRQELVPADSYAAATRAEPAYGITWDAHVFRELGPRDGQGQVRAGYERIPTVLDRALDGITSTREAWLILDATLRTLRWAAAERQVLAQRAALAASAEVECTNCETGRVSESSGWLTCQECRDAEDDEIDNAEPTQELGDWSVCEHGNKVYAEDCPADQAVCGSCRCGEDEICAHGNTNPEALAETDEGTTWAVDIATPATSTGYGTTVTREGLDFDEAVRHVVEYLDARTPMRTDVRHRIAEELRGEHHATAHQGYHAALRSEDD